MAVGRGRRIAGNQHDYVDIRHRLRYIFSMRLSWDEAKRRRILAERNVDFAEAALVFAGPTLEFEDTRKDYGETRIVCVGFLRGRMIVLVYRRQGTERRIISMRKANDREQKIYRAHLGGP